MKTAEILLSCMHQKLNSIEIVKKAKLSNNVLVINQCDVDKESTESYDNHIIKINTPTRGLSVSRNLAIAKSEAEICVLADDDERFVQGIQDLIAAKHSEHSEADIILFKIINRPHKLKPIFHKLKKLELFHTTSPQITFKRKRILEKGISFDTKLGSGTGNGDGEEIKFLLDCYQQGLSIYYEPIEIASRVKLPSQWFFGYDERFFYNKGGTSRYIFGLPISLVYTFYYIIKHYAEYKEEISLTKALANMIKGIIDNKINNS